MPLEQRSESPAWLSSLAVADSGRRQFDGARSAQAAAAAAALDAVEALGQALHAALADMHVGAADAGTAAAAAALGVAAALPTPPPAPAVLVPLSGGAAAVAVEDLCLSFFHPATGVYVRDLPLQQNVPAPADAIAAGLQPLLARLAAAAAMPDVSASWAAEIAAAASAPPPPPLLLNANTLLAAASAAAGLPLHHTAAGAGAAPFARPGPWRPRTERQISLAAMAAAPLPLPLSLPSMGGAGSASAASRSAAGDAASHIPVPALVPVPVPIPESDLEVGSGSVDEFASKLAAFVAWYGVRGQLTALYAGLTAVAERPLALCAFTPGELRSLACGSARIEWDLPALQAHVRVGSGYKPGDPAVGFFLEALLALGQDERAEFLHFATGNPTLPPNGLAGLDPPLQITRKDGPVLPPRSVRLAAIASGAGGASAAETRHDWTDISVSACFHQLKIPPYSSLAVMKERLRIAVKSSAGLMDLS